MRGHVAVLGLEQHVAARSTSRAPKGWLPWVMARRATSNDRRRKCASRSEGVSVESSTIQYLTVVVSIVASMPRHMPADFGEVRLAGAGLVDEFAVEHHHQTVRQFQQLVEVLADQ